MEPRVLSMSIPVREIAGAGAEEQGDGAGFLSPVALMGSRDSPATSPLLREGLQLHLVEQSGPVVRDLRAVLAALREGGIEDEAARRLEVSV